MSNKLPALDDVKMSPAIGHGEPIPDSEAGKNLKQGAAIYEFARKKRRG